MNEIYIRNKKYEDIAVLIFRVLFLAVGFLQASSLTFGKPIISFVQWPTVFLGGVIILYRVLFCRRFINTRGIWFLVIFALGFVASAVYTVEYGFYENLRMFLFLVMQFGILYAYDSETDPGTDGNQFDILAWVYLAGTAILSVISFVFLITGHNKIIFPAEGTVGPIYYHGFVHGRLFGAYWDPNIAATMAALAILISVYFAAKHKNLILRILLSLNIILQIMYITFSDSRTGIIVTVAGVSVYALTASLKKLPVKNIPAKILCSVLITAVCFSAAVFVPKMAKEVYNQAVTVEQNQEEVQTGSSAGSSTDEEKTETSPEPSAPAPSLDRGYDTEGDISNRRFDIWKAAFEVFKTSPIIGVSRANILAYVESNLPDSYLITNAHMKFDSMHNLVFEILASGGLVGIISFVLFALWTVLYILKNFKKMWDSHSFEFFVLVLSIAAAVCVSTLVMAEIVYVTSPISTVFWVGIGTLSHRIANVSKGEEGTK